MTNSNERYHVTKKDLTGVYWRWYLTAATSWNYETQQSGCIVIALAPLLRKIYKDDDQYRDAVLAHYGYYNSHRKMSNLVLGAVVALEENYDEDNPEQTREAVTAIKSSLMGPFAGIGDSLLSSIPQTICASISAYMALEGSPIGLIFGLVLGVALQPLCRYFVTLGYKFGANVMTLFADQIKMLTNSAQVLGLTVVGGMVAANVSIPITLTYTYGEVVLSFQTFADQIMPKLTSALFVGLIYWILGRKKMTSGKCILIILAISFVLYNLGICA